MENSLKQYLIENEYKDLNNNEKLIDDDYDVTGLCESVCQSLETLGYIHPILAEKIQASKVETNIKSDAKAKSKKKHSR